MSQDSFTFIVVLTSSQAYSKIMYCWSTVLLFTTESHHACHLCSYESIIGIKTIMRDLLTNTAWHRWSISSFSFTRTVSGQVDNANRVRKSNLSLSPSLQSADLKKKKRYFFGPHPPKENYFVSSSTLVYQIPQTLMIHRFVYNV